MLTSIWLLTLTDCTRYKCIHFQMFWSTSRLLCITLLRAAVNENPGVRCAAFLLHRTVARKRHCIVRVFPQHVPACNVVGIHCCCYFTVRAVSPEPAGIQAMFVLQEVAYKCRYKKRLQATKWRLQTDILGEESPYSNTFALDLLMVARRTGI